MPRSLGLFLGSTYQQLLTRTLPPVIQGWEQLGYVRDRDFFFGRYADKKMKWDKPFFTPLDPKRFIHWRFGSGVSLASQDRDGATAGMSYDWIAADEGKHLNHHRYEHETLQGNRGNEQYFAGNPLHHSILITTDMPTTPDAMWILEQEKKMDPEIIELIIGILLTIRDIKASILTGKLAVSTVAKYNSKLAKYEKQLDILRSNAVFFSEASTLENVEVLGDKFLEQMRRTLRPSTFRSSILNERLVKVEGGFYPDLDEYHFYEKYDNGYLDSLDFDMDKLSVPDCRMDGDLDKNQPLYIAPDYGANFNCVVVGQPFKGEFRFQKEFFIYKPQKIKHLVYKFDAYYKTRKNRTIVFCYDHTAIGADPVREITFLEEWEEQLQMLGYRVVRKYIGQAPGHHSKYNFWGHFLDDKDKHTPRCRINKGNCPMMITSMQLAPVKDTEKGFKKDKSSERDENIDQAEATHLSDAADVLGHAMYEDCFQGNDQFLPNIYS